MAPIWKEQSENLEINERKSCFEIELQLKNKEMKLIKSIFDNLTAMCKECSLDVMLFVSKGKAIHNMLVSIQNEYGSKEVNVTEIENDYLVTSNTHLFTIVLAVTFIEMHVLERSFNAYLDVEKQKN
jgi:hypothetical protein